MITILVDVDDTLVLWQPHAVPDCYDYHNTFWAPNNILIEEIKHHYLENYPNCAIVVWSAGGKDYAQLWADKFFADYRPLGVAKDIDILGLLFEEDIVIDDMAEEMNLYGGRPIVYKPNDLSWRQ